MTMKRTHIKRVRAIGLKTEKAHQLLEGTTEFWEGTERQRQRQRQRQKQSDHLANLPIVVRVGGIHHGLKLLQ